MRFFFCLLLSVFCFSTAYAENQQNPLTGMVTSDGIIHDTQNNRYVTGCWEGKGNETFLYTVGNEQYLEVCNEPDASTFGNGATPLERAQNYYDFLQKTGKNERTKNPNIKIVLGSISGYNYQWFREFMNLPDACGLFDVLAFHPYHMGIAPDEINTEKDSWHTVEQWVYFYKNMLFDRKCEKPLWVTEFGYTTVDTDAERAVTEEQQVDYAIKQAIIMLGAGVSRVEYHSAKYFQLSSKGVDQYESFLHALSGTHFEKLDFFGDSYCPRGIKAGCMYTNDQYANDTNIIDYGLPVKNTELKKGRKYTFSSDSKTVEISWMIGFPGYEIVETLKNGTQQKKFSDLSPTHPAYTAIVSLAKQGILQGYSDGTFRPESPLSRAELVKLIFVGAKKSTNSESKNCFRDIADEWFASFVCTAKDEKIVSGYADSTFRPANPVSRAEAIKVLLNAFQIPRAEGGEKWWDEYFSGAQKAKILHLGEISPEDAQKSISRGEMAIFLSRAIDE